MPIRILDFAAIGIFGVLSSCNQPAKDEPSQLPSKHLEEVRYISSDSRFAMVVGKTTARAGPIEALDQGRWPDYPKRDIQAGGIQCVSVGPPGNTEEYAVKRPLKLGETYKCEGASFKVEHCFEQCMSAIVKREAPLTGNRSGTLPTYMLVDRCAGIIAISPMKELTPSIPLDALILRESVGILADRGSECR